MTYYTPSEVAKMLKLSESKVRELFAGRPGVVVIHAQKLGRRPYRTIRISDTALRALERA